VRLLDSISLKKHLGSVLKINLTYQQMNSSIPEFRLNNQQITANKFDSPNRLVAYMGAIQAQDYLMSKWAIGLRLPKSTDSQIEAALDAGQLVRTHVMRPTWHIVAGQDVRWMLAISKKQIKSAMSSYAKDLGIDTTMYNRSKDLIIKALEGSKNLTRTEIMTEIELAGIKTSSGHAVHFMMNAEVEGIVCNGVMRGKEQTYTLLDEKVPKGLTFSYEEAISELAKRYFMSHAPATIHDFNWWSGLGMNDCRSGIESIKSDLESFQFEEKIYFIPKDFTEIQPKNSIFFLPAFDEYCVSYKNRNAVFNPAWHKEAITSNGIFKPIIVVNGQVVGIWKRTIKSKFIVIETTFFDKKDRLENALIEQSLVGFSDFWGLPVEIA
jgi:hypothetical protein